MIRWIANLGSTYRVQYKDNLAEPAWTEVPGEVTAASATAEKSDGSANLAVRRFYRIELVR